MMSHPMLPQDAHDSFNHFLLGNSFLMDGSLWAKRFRKSRRWCIIVMFQYRHSKSHQESCDQWASPDSTTWPATPQQRQICKLGASSKHWESRCSVQNMSAKQLQKKFRLQQDIAQSPSASYKLPRFWICKIMQLLILQAGWCSVD